MNKNTLMTAIVLCVFAFGVAQAQDWTSLPEKKRTKLGLYMSPKQAYVEVTKNGAKTLFIDVRSRPEVNFLGTPTVVDANVPYMELNEWFAFDEKKQHFKMEVNSEFASDVAAQLAKKGLSKDDMVILLCRSGSRSSKAANLLAELGYTRVYSVVDGFEGDKAKEGPHKGQRVVNGWKVEGLPWTYKLELAKMYKVGG